MSNKSAYQGRVSGIVQGVCFRAETCKLARKLGLTGWVRNCSNGDVEVLIAGSGPALEQMHVWLHQGPEYAQVESVALSACDDPGLTGFDIRY